MNFADPATAVRLLPGKDRGLPGKIARLKPFLKRNGIRTVFIRAAADPGPALRAAGLLKGNFKVLLECAAGACRALEKKIKKAGGIALAPAFDLGAPVSELRAIFSAPAARRKSAFLFLTNSAGISDEGTLRRACAAIIRETGPRDVTFIWDCGFVLCAFSEEELGFFIEKGSPAACSCPGLATIDENLDIRFCGRLGPREPRSRVRPGASLPGLGARFCEFVRPYRDFGVRAGCGACRRLRNSCLGGCRDVVRKSFS